MSDSPGRSTTQTVVIVVIAIACVVLVGGLVLGITAGGGSGGSGTAQTPFVVDGPQANVEMDDLDFSPRDLTINVGATVTWTNKEAAPHDATSDDDEWETDLLQEGDTGSITFAEAGTFPYHCTVHPNMEGTVTVR